MADKKSGNGKPSAWVSVKSTAGKGNANTNSRTSNNPPPLMGEEEIKRLNRIMFDFDPHHNRLEVRMSPSQDYPPWKYMPTHLSNKHTVDYMFHPDLYKTNKCKRVEDGKQCGFEHCAFVHPGERYVPRWRNSGSYFDGNWYPPLPITYKWFAYLMMEFKTTGPCRRETCEDWSICGDYHEDLENPGVYVDQRFPVEYNPRTGDFTVLSTTSAQGALQYHPHTYKKYPCEKLKNQEICVRGRYCSFDHLHGETKKIQEYKQKLLKSLRDAYEASSSQGGNTTGSKDYVPVGMQAPSTKNKRRSKLPTATGDKEKTDTPSDTPTPLSMASGRMASGMGGVGSESSDSLVSAASNSTMQTPWNASSFGSNTISPMANQGRTLSHQYNNRAPMRTLLKGAVGVNEADVVDDNNDQDGPGEWIKAQRQMEQQSAEHQRQQLLLQQQKQQQQQLAYQQQQQDQLLNLMAAQGIPITPQSLTLLGVTVPDQQALFMRIRQMQQLQQMQLQQQQLQHLQQQQEFGMSRVNATDNVASLWGNSEPGTPRSPAQRTLNRDPTTGIGRQTGMAGLTQSMQTMQLGGHGHSQSTPLLGQTSDQLPHSFNNNHMMAMGQSGMLPPGFQMPSSQMMGYMSQAKGMTSSGVSDQPPISSPSLGSQPMTPFGMSYERHDNPVSDIPSTPIVPPGPPASWTMAQVYLWASTHRVNEIRAMSSKLRDNHITGDMLDETHRDFKDMLKGIGIVSWGHQRKFSDAVKELRLS